MPVRLLRQASNNSGDYMNYTGKKDLLMGRGNKTA